MKFIKQAVIFFSLIFAITIFLTRCSTNIEPVKDFSDDELKWYKPYNKTTTVIYVSEKGESDTITFHKTEADADSTRDFEQGFSNTNYLTVPYEFTKGSYHQFAIMGDGINRYDQAIFNMAKSSTGYSSLEIIFIGILFNDTELKNIQKIGENLYFFDGKKATYPGMNVEKEIKDFTFDTETGVVTFTDDRGVKWKRK